MIPRRIRIKHFLPFGSVLLFLLLGLLLDQVIGRTLFMLHQKVMTGDFVGRVNKALKVKLTDIIIFGSSRATHHLDPAVIEPIINRSVFNAGADNCFLEYAMLLSHLIIDRGSSTKLFLLQVDYSSLTKFGLPRARRLLPFMDELPLIAEEINKENIFTWIKILSRSYRFNGLASAVVLRYFLPGPPIGNGFSPLSGQLKASTATQTYASQEKVRPEAKRFLHDFIQNAYSKGIEVVLVAGPYYLPGTKGSILERDELIRLSRIEGVELLQIDEKNYPELREISLFRDQSHLNQKGSAIYSKLVAQSLAPRLKKTKQTLFQKPSEYLMQEHGDKLELLTNNAVIGRLLN